MDGRNSWPAALVALGFLALVGVMFWRASENMDNFDKIWAVAGPIVGVVVGAVPGFFFAQGARRDQQTASQRAEAYALALPTEVQPKAMAALTSIQGTTNRR